MKRLLVRDRRPGFVAFLWLDGSDAQPGLFSAGPGSFRRSAARLASLGAAADRRGRSGTPSRTDLRPGRAFDRRKIAAILDGRHAPDHRCGVLSKPEEGREVRKGGRSVSDGLGCGPSLTLPARSANASKKFSAFINRPPATSCTMDTNCSAVRSVNAPRGCCNRRPAARPESLHAVFAGHQGVDRRRVGRERPHRRHRDRLSHRDAMAGGDKDVDPSGKRSDRTTGRREIQPSGMERKAFMMNAK